MGKDNIRSGAIFILIVILGISLLTLTTRFIRKTNKETKEIEKRITGVQKETVGASATNPQKPEIQKSKAIAFVKNYILTKEGFGRSYLPIGESVDWFLNAMEKGFKGKVERIGWGAEQVEDGLWLVTYNFKETSGSSQKAVWEANLKTKKVICKSKTAEQIGWCPDY